MNLKNLSPRERTLALLSGGTLFIVLNLLFLPKLTAANRAAHQKNSELKAQLAAAEGWIAKEDYWTKRRDWLEETEPSLSVARQDSATQLEQLQAAARKLSLQLEDVQLLQLPEAEFYQPVGVKFTVNGPWAGLVKFVADLQDPKLFDVIPRFSIKSDREPPNIHCEMELQRWFHKRVDDNQ